jgi:Helix-turn-helix of DDE superfamily endonuclease
MREGELINLKESDFKRLTGVRRATYRAMVTEVEAQAAHFGRPPKLSCADQVLMTLMYWREYRTLFHIAQTYQVSEATTSRIIRKTEDILIKAPSGAFRLPGKKTLTSSDLTLNVVVVDATEQPIERPKKN